MTDALGVLVLLLVAAGLLVLLLTALLVRRLRWPPRRTAGYAVARGLAADPGDLGLPFESWTLDRPGGVRLPVWEIPARETAAAAEPLTVVLAHGWGQSRIDMLARLGPYADLARRLVLYDRRGHGEAAGGPSALGHGEERDLLALLERLGPGRFVLVGHSMGGVIAIHAAATPPAAAGVAGVVAYSPYVDFHRSLRGRLRAQGYPVRPITDLALGWLRLRGLRLRRTAAAAVRCPLLVVHGTADHVAPLSGAEAIVSAAADAALHPAPGARHHDAHLVDESGHEAVVRGFFARLA